MKLQLYLVLAFCLSNTLFEINRKFGKCCDIWRKVDTSGRKRKTCIIHDTEKIDELYSLEQWRLCNSRVKNQPLVALAKRGSDVQIVPTLSCPHTLPLARFNIPLPPPLLIKKQKTKLTSHSVVTIFHPRLTHSEL